MSMSKVRTAVRFFLGGKPRRRGQRPTAMDPFYGVHMGYVVVDVDDGECQPVFPVRPGAKQTSPVFRSASTEDRPGTGIP